MLLSTTRLCQGEKDDHHYHHILEPGLMKGIYFWHLRLYRKAKSELG